MEVTHLLVELQQRGVELMVAGNRLRYRPQEAVTPALLGELRQHKAELIPLLAQQEIAGKRRTPCGWFCYDIDLSLPCRVVDGRQTLEEYAQECAQAGCNGEALRELYEVAYGLFLALGGAEGIAPYRTAPCYQERPRRGSPA